MTDDGNEFARPCVAADSGACFGGYNCEGNRQGFCLGIGIAFLCLAHEYQKVNRKLDEIRRQRESDGYNGDNYA